MASAWTLPLIRIELDGLPLGCEFILESDDAARLFGASDAASRLVSIFAASHGCRAVFRRNELVFQKRLQSGTPAPADELGSVECFPPLCPPPRPSSDDYPSVNCR
jgi:hypothetical protein